MVGLNLTGDFPAVSVVKCLPTMWKTRVRSLGQEDPLEKEMAITLQDYCLENPMDRGAWWATAHGVAKSRTRLSDFTFTSTLDCFPYFASIDSTA